MDEYSEQESEEEPVKKSFVERYLIISPEAKWKSIFDIIILFMVGYSCFVNMFAFAYDFQSPDALLVTDEIVENFFRVDFFLNFLQGYRHPDTYENITDLKLIALNYLFTWFIIDFLSIFPFSIFMDNAENSTTFKLLRLLRMPRLSKLIDIGRVKKILKAF